MEAGLQVPALELASRARGRCGSHPGYLCPQLETRLLERYDPARARFRAYLRVCLDGYAANAHKPDRRLKRGGAVVWVPLDFTTAEGEIAHHQPAVRPDVEELFYREC